MRFFCCLTVILTHFLVHAQTENVFRVSMPKHIQLSPAKTVLEPATEYRFQVSGVPANRIVKFYFMGGTAEFKNSELVLHTQDTGDPKKKFLLRAIIKVRDNLKEITVKAFFISKVYKYVKADEGDSVHVVFYWGHRALKLRDTALINKMPDENFLAVHRKVSPDTRYSILSYKLSVTCDSVKRNYQLTGTPNFPGEFLRNLATIHPGTVITFSEIAYSPNNESADVRMAGPFSIFVKK